MYCRSLFARLKFFLVIYFFWPTWKKISKQQISYQWLNIRESIFFSCELNWLQSCERCFCLLPWDIKTRRTQTWMLVCSVASWNIICVLWNADWTLMCTMRHHFDTDEWKVIIDVYLFALLERFFFYVPFIETEGALKLFWYWISECIVLLKILKWRV